MVIVAVLSTPAFAVSARELMKHLNAEQQRVYQTWRQHRAAHQRRHNAYWARIAALKSQRKRKRRAGHRIGSADYMSQHPPRYAGPRLRSDIVKIRKALERREPRPRRSSITPLSAMLVAAQRYYRFKPTRTTEQEFKRRYAAEALAVGLSKDQIVRIYALETGGRGTFDMQAGIHPISRRGQPISTALGYAQLLAANTIDQVSRRAGGFIARLNMLAARPGLSPARRQQLRAKVRSLRAMQRVANSIPRRWNRHVALSKTPRGYGMHVLNLDADIGPWLQVMKVAGLQQLAARRGRTRLTGAQIELMNLAGPATGLEMMTPAARRASTANFFSRRGYYRNTIVRWKSAPQLLQALDQRMNIHLKKPGSVEFAAIFDSLRRDRRARGAGRYGTLPPAIGAAASRSDQGVVIPQLRSTMSDRGPPPSLFVD